MTHRTVLSIVIYYFLLYGESFWNEHTHTNTQSYKINSETKNRQNYFIYVCMNLQFHFFYKQYNNNNNKNNNIIFENAVTAKEPNLYVGKKWIVEK